MSKRQKMMSLSVALFTWVVLSIPANAQSLWNNGSSLFADQRASQVGDIVTVQVIERLDNSDEGKTDSSKSAQDSVNRGTGILSFIRSLGLSSASNYQGDGKSERTLKAGTIVSCLVTEVLPNGNLIIQGDRQIVTHRERLTIRFSGVVRPIDINANNVVPSNLVANAEVSMTGKGTVSRTQQPGIVTQVLQAVF